MNNLLMIWTKEAEIGIPILDEQHHGLTSIVNSLFYCMGEGRGKKVLCPSISLFELYAQIHFEVEEGLMREIGFDGLNKHAAAHEKLDRQLTTLLAKNRCCEDPSSLIQFFKDAWLDHVCKWDRLYVEPAMEYIQKHSA